MFDELVKKYNLSPNPLNLSLLNFNKGIKLSLLMNNIYDKDKRENYNLFFLTLFLSKNANNDTNISEKYHKFINKIKDANEKANRQNNEINFLEKIRDKLQKFSYHKYMIYSFIQLNKYQQKEILLIAEFILNHKENDPLWKKYQELIKEVKKFFS